MNQALLELFGKRPSVPLKLDSLPDFMREYLELVSQGTDCRPGILLTAWLPYLAANLGNRVYAEVGSLRIYPNIWACVIGPSSISRKTTALRYAGLTHKPYQDELSKSDPASYELLTLVLNGTTASKLLSLMHLNPCRLFVHNEFSGWLADMQQSYNKNYKQSLTEIYDGVTRNYMNQERSELIEEPALSVIGASTQDWFYATITNRDQLVGFLQRILYCVVRKEDLTQLELSSANRANSLGESLAAYDARFYRAWRALPGRHELKMDAAAADARDQYYAQAYHKISAYNSDNLMSYFTRVYDGYFYKFALIIHMAKCWRQVNEAIRLHTEDAWFRNTRIELETIVEAAYLCDFYMEHIFSILDIMDERDSLATERKLVDLLVNRFGGKATHSELMNASRQKKRDFKDATESLIDRGAITVETGVAANNKPTRLYLLDRDLLSSWNNRPGKK
ncbi:MAG: DUF3987 domain-containing protein [Candidatus Cloacimonetes bacterium]|nr:DUF3987 domain-containing protein [Candidatus Cloacimonadota bacterium]MDY0367223.1 DUF3987 domain-containing protein [Candidatus Syntrophosphaera sp.]